MDPRLPRAYSYEHAISRTGDDNAALVLESLLPVGAQADRGVANVGLAAVHRPPMPLALRRTLRECIGRTVGCHGTNGCHSAFTATGVRQLHASRGTSAEQIQLEGTVAEPPSFLMLYSIVRRACVFELASCRKDPRL